MLKLLNFVVSILHCALGLLLVLLIAAAGATGFALTLRSIVRTGAKALVSLVA